MAKPKIAVDWDDTCVEGVWPRRDGSWKIGAVEALTELQDLFEVWIWSTRVAPVMPAPDYNWRDAEELAGEIQAIRDKLDEAGLTEIRIWTNPWKVDACVAYVDDRAVHYTGESNAWEEVTAQLKGLIGKSHQGVVRRRKRNHSRNTRRIRRLRESRSSTLSVRDSG